MDDFSRLNRGTKYGSMGLGDWLALVGGLIGRRRHKKNNYDLIWSIMASYAGFAASSFKQKTPDVPYLLTLQEGDDLRTVEKKVRFVWKKFLFILQTIFVSIIVPIAAFYLGLWVAEKIGMLR